jgi:RNA recognition motif-containing protein
MDKAAFVDSGISKIDNAEQEHQRVNNSGLAQEAKKSISKHVIEHQPQQEHRTTTNADTPYSSTTVYISGIPIRYCTESVIEKIMLPYGKIIRCTVHTQQPPKVFAFCDYDDPVSASTAIRAVNGRKLGGQSLIVRPAFKEQQSLHHHGTTTTTTAARMVDNTNTGVSIHNDAINNHSHPKRQRQQIDSKIDAIANWLNTQDNKKL